MCIIPELNTKERCHYQIQHTSVTYQNTCGGNFSKQYNDPFQNSEHKTTFLKNFIEILNILRGMIFLDLKYDYCNKKLIIPHLMKLYFKQLRFVCLKLSGHSRLVILPMFC